MYSDDKDRDMGSPHEEDGDMASPDNDEDGDMGSPDEDEIDIDDI